MMLGRRTLLQTSAATASSLITPEFAVAQQPVPEDIIEPGLEIVDPHHHLWDFPPTNDAPARRYVLDDFLADAASGHNITATVFAECLTSYRADGPAELKSLGETEFVTAIANASAARGGIKVAHGIVGHVDLNIGDRAKGVLEAHMAAAGGRFRGIRDASAWDEFPFFGRPLDPKRRDLLESAKFREGFAALEKLNLSFDAFCFHTQIDQVTGLAKAFPGTKIILDHLGSPLGAGPYAGRKAEVFAAWRKSIEALAQATNVYMKVGGLGMRFVAMPSFQKKPQATSEQIANDWRPFVDVAINAFGPARCMFESNVPPDKDTGSYRTLWNVFKRLAAGYSPSEKARLFSGTAREVYRLKD